MDPVEALRLSAGRTDKDKDTRDAYMHRLRRNSILTWLERLEYVLRFKEILQSCNMFSTLTIESGIVRIDPEGRYISHRFVPYVKAGFSFNEVATLMRAEIISFEEEYGEVFLTESDIKKLQNVVYKYNRQITDKLDMSDKKKLIHLEQTAIVFYYLVSSRITLKAQVNGWCTLTFPNNNNHTEDYCTILTEEEIMLLEKLSLSLKH